jgi:hypothetical protein
MEFFRSNYCLGIYLHSNRISKSWVQWIEDELPSSVNYIKRFINITGLFSIYLFDECYSKGLRKQYNLNQWVKAIALDSKILIFANFYNATNWRLILRHEIFHASISGCYKMNQIIPVWFNEAIAYYIGENTNVKVEDLNKIRVDISQIKNMLMNDTLFENYQYGYSVIKLLGKFFCTAYSNDKIMMFFDALNLVNDFKTCFANTFGCTLSDFINKWADDLFSLGTQEGISL